MKCEDCKNNSKKLIYKPEDKKWLCPECRHNHTIATIGKRENIFIVHQAIKRDGAPML